MLFGVQMSIAATLYFADKAGINPGIIMTIFTSCLIMIALYFYFVYGQRLTLRDFVGGLFILACTIMIALSNATGGS